MTTFTEPIEVSTRSDIAIVFQGDAYVNRRRVATFLVMRWNVEKSDWTKATARNIPKGQPIIGRSKRARIDVTINSGYIFVNMKIEKVNKYVEITVWEKEPGSNRVRPVKKMIKKFKNVKVAYVEEVFSGEIHKVNQGDTLGATTEDIPAGKATTPNSTVPHRRRHRAP